LTLISCNVNLTNITNFIYSVLPKETNTMSASKRSFEQIAKTYAESVDTKPIHIYYNRPNFLSLVPVNLNHLNALDIGCGSGWFSEYLLKAGAQVTALDVSPTLVELTKQRIGGKGKVHVADLNKPLDFLPDKTFDLIIASLVIHYVDDWTQLFASLGRVIKPNSILVFSTHQPHTEIELFHLENYYQKVPIIDHWKDVCEVQYYHHTLHDLSDSLYNAGFLIERMLEPPPLPELQNADPEMYKNITTRPWILFVRAIKSKN